ncbi:glycoside hydrolase family 53 protein [Flavobacterium sp. 3HN19-14]|uniref:glycoside hydrolase family 53 protein n=1 Tax=Flavobacterium sp. 3HN19-14 TaxID=3448133 RepID=UPI003EDF7DCB
MKKYVLLGILALAAFAFSCSKDDKETTEPPAATDDFLRGADVSFLPEIESAGTIYYNNGAAEDVLTTLKNAGCNAIRIRLWKDPATPHSGLAEVKALAQRVKAAGMKVWLTVHYSDTWADPGNQTTPAAWQSLSFANLKTEVAAYTTSVINEIHPDIYQIGNETNDGFLWPQGKITTNEAQYLELVTAASAAIRTAAPETKIMLHFAGMEGADWFFNKVSNIDYDYIGLSYYPVWHGKNLTTVKNTVDALGAAYNKKVIIAETAYPFTLGWDDYTDNIVGLDSQLIPAFSATPEGQKSYLTTLRAVLKTSTSSYGFCYWGTEWLAFERADCNRRFKF